MLGMETTIFCFIYSGVDLCLTVATYNSIYMNYLGGEWESWRGATLCKSSNYCSTWGLSRLESSVLWEILQLPTIYFRIDLKLSTRDAMKNEGFATCVVS